MRSFLLAFHRIAQLDRFRDCVLLLSAVIVFPFRFGDRHAEQSPLDLLLEHLLDLPDLLLDFAGPVFGFAFSL
jgi:hypothetical protein